MFSISLEAHLKQTRTIMKKMGLDAIFIPTNDPHGTEYLPEHWALRAYLSGFNGSAGTLVITVKNAYLWVDSRYWLESEKMFKDTFLKVMRQGAKEVPSVLSFCCSELKKNQVIGFDPQMVSMQLFSQYIESLENHQIIFKSIPHLADLLWTSRPKKPSTKIVEHDVAFAGESRTDKIKKIQLKMIHRHATCLLISSLYDLAWLFNLRAQDTPYTPVFLGYALVFEDSVTLFVQKKALSSDVKKALIRDGIGICDYHEIGHELTHLPAKTKLLYSKYSTSVELGEVIPKKIKQIACDPSLVSEEKAIKNQQELAHLQKAMSYDGVALLRFYQKFELELKKGKKITELTVGESLDAERLKMPHNRGISFSSIVAYNAHAAMCHYHATPKTQSQIKQEGVLLIDSGGQYLTGTTDITRTFGLGECSNDYRRDYTLVLKGHLAVAHAVFPEGTKGSQLDTLARQYLWQYGLDFGHGTGHGIGFYLNVHEGPCGISAAAHTPLKVGHCLTNEPGLYREGLYGIRIENVLTVSLGEKTSMGQFLKFENLTLFPYDLKSIEKSLLTTEEIEQVNAYHNRVYRVLSPLLDKDEKRYLRALTKSL